MNDKSEGQETEASAAGAEDAKAGAAATDTAETGGDTGSAAEGAGGESSEPPARDESASAASGDAPAAAGSEPSVDDSEEIEPEEVALEPVPRAKLGSHHPPPPPSLRAEAKSHPERPIELQGEPKLAKDLMARKLFTVGPADPIGGLAGHMHQFHFRHLPVVDGEKMVGLIELEDLLHASSSFLSERAKERDALIHKTPAKRVMREQFPTVLPDQPLDEVAKVMWSKRSRCLPVVDADGKLVGIITEGDFVRLAHHLMQQSAKG